MLWEHNSTIIVMLTRLREMGRVSNSPPPGPSSAWEHTSHVFTTLSCHTQTLRPLPHHPRCPALESSETWSSPPPVPPPDHGGWVLCPQEKCHQYWPAERSARYQYFVVDPMAEYNMPQYILREFKVTDARVSVERGVCIFAQKHICSTC